MPSEDRELRCPSAQPDMREAQVLGAVVGEGEGRRVAYLNARLPVGEAMTGSLKDVASTRTLRFAAICESSRCVHFEGGACTLARRIVEGLDPVVGALPPCAIRPRCRWFAQEGREACLRCPQVVTTPAPGTEGALASVAVAAE